MNETIKLRGERVKRARVYRGFSQKDLSEQIGVSQSNLSFIEGNRHNANSDTVKSLCDILDVTLEWLKGDTMEGGVPLDDTPSVKEHERIEISKRFIDAYERLKILGIIESDADFAEFATIPRSTLSLALAGKNPVSLEWIPFLEEKGANRDYIYNNMVPIIRKGTSKKIKDAADITTNIISLVQSIEEDMKLLKSYLNQVL